MTLSQKRSEAITEVQRARLDALYRTGNNHAHPKEAVNTSDVQALKSPRIGLGVFYPHAPLILPNVRGATGEASIPRIAACARVVPSMRRPVSCLTGHYRALGQFDSILQRRSRVEGSAVTCQEFLPAFVVKSQHGEIEFIMTWSYCPICGVLGHVPVTGQRRRPGSLHCAGIIDFW
jgi:hypothetical protein